MLTEAGAGALLSVFHSLPRASRAWHFCYGLGTQVGIWGACLRVGLCFVKEIWPQQSCSSPPSACSPAARALHSICWLWCAGRGRPNGFIAERFVRLLYVGRRISWDCRLLNQAAASVLWLQRGMQCYILILSNSGKK